MALPTIYKIHPAIGVARIGDSPTAFFIGPEVPGRPVEGDSSFGSMVPPFKDGGTIKRQGARFRIWRYDDNGKGKYKAVEEINLDTKDVEYIVWTVHLANKKAAFFTFHGLRGDKVNAPYAVVLGRRNHTVTSRKDLWIDPGLRRISGRNKKADTQKGTAPSGSTEYWPKDPPQAQTITDLGELRTDGVGRLVVLGGHGNIGSTGAFPISNYANNDGWYDDVSDGPVNANIKFKGVANLVPAVGAWCLCGPPCFSPFSRNVVSLWDTLFDVAAREMALPTNDAKYDGPLASLKAVNTELKGEPWGYVKLASYKPVFETDILPILRAALDIPFLFEAAKTAHYSLAGAGLAAFYPQFADPTNSSGASLRLRVLQYLHQPGVAGVVPPATMPKQLGDDPYGEWSIGIRQRLTVTPTQYAMMERWASGNFTSSTTAPPALPAATITPDGLDRAALESCVGGAFYPGIECSWQIRNPLLFLEPFRINQAATSQYLSESGTIEPGHFSRQMALPWAADFLQCRTETPDPTAPNDKWAWWPVPRPHEIYPTEAAAKARGPMVRWARSTASGVTASWPGASGVEPDFDAMLDHWKHFGFVIRKEDVLFETERPPNVP